MSRKDEELAVWFTPEAIRQHFEDDKEASKMLEGVGDEMLREAAEAWLFGSNSFWRRFDEACREILEDARDGEGV